MVEVKNGVTTPNTKDQESPMGQQRLSILLLAKPEGCERPMSLKNHTEQQHFHWVLATILLISSCLNPDALDCRQILTSVNLPANPSPEESPIKVGRRNFPAGLSVLSYF